MSLYIRYILFFFPLVYHLKNIRQPIWSLYFPLNPINFLRELSHIYEGFKFKFLLDNFFTRVE